MGLTASSSSYKYLYNILVTGDGTSSFINMWQENHPNFRVNTDIFLSLRKESEGTQSPVRGIHGIVILYDVSNRNSFKNIRFHIEKYQKIFSELVVLMIVGLDLSSSRVVSLEEGKSLALNYGCLFQELNPSMVSPSFWTDMINKISLV